MKLLKTPVTLLALLLCFPPVFSQNKDNPCGKYWGPWETTPLYANGGVQFAVQHSTCGPNGICGWPIIGLQHTFAQPVTIGLTLKGIGCDNKEIVTSFSTGGNEVPANTEEKGSGNWHMFKRVDEVIKVEVHYHKGDDYYSIIWDKSVGHTVTLINGKTPEQIASEKQEAAEQKKKDEADKKQREDKEKKDKDEAEKRKKEDEVKKKADDDKKKNSNTGNRGGNDNNGNQNNNPRVKSKEEIYAERKTLDDQFRKIQIDQMTAFWTGDWKRMSFRDPGFAVSLSEGLSTSLIPTIVNYSQSDGAGKRSSTDVFFSYGVSNNLEIWPYRNNHFGIGAFGGLEFDWGLSEYGETNALIANYGFKILGGLDKLKLVAEYSQGYRSVSGDISVSAWSGVTIFESGSSDYDYSRMGLGLMGDFSDDESETSVTLMLYKDHLNFMPQAVSSYACRLYVRWDLDFYAEYGHNYAVGGQALYPMDDKNHNQDYFLLGFVKNANLAAAHYR